MGRRRLVVVGGEIAGIMAAAKGAEENPDLDIKVLLPGKFFMPSGYQLACLIRDVDVDMHSYMSEIREGLNQQYNVEILPCRKTVDIVSLEKKVVFRNLLEGSQGSLEFDKLIIATGTRTIIPSVDGIDAENVFFLDSIEDVHAIREGIDAGLYCKAVVIGATPLGIYVAESLWRRGLEVILVEGGQQILDGFDAEIAQFVIKQMEQKGVKVLLGEKILSLIGNAKGQVVEVHTPNHILTTDMVIWLKDIKPDAEIAKKAGIAIGKTGAIEVDEYLETNIPGIYAIGNCAQYINQISGKPTWVYNMFVDRRAVRVAGYNAAGDNEFVLSKGICGTVSIRAFGLNISKTGLSAAEAAQEVYQVEMAKVSVNDDQYGCEKGCRDNIAKLIINKTDRKILGIQSIGGSLSEKIVDVVTTVMDMGGTLEDLNQLDLVGHLPHTRDMHPIHLAADVMFEKLTGKVRGVSAYELYQLLYDPQVVVLDVRTKSEALMGMLPGTVNIPLSELEEMKERLTGHKAIVLVSNRGRRAYAGFIKLKELGFDNISILEGGLSAYPY